MAEAADAQRRRPDVQGLRGVAVLLVVLYHTGGVVRGGFTGVDVFFVISGFVITQSLLRGDMRLVPFYVRRVRRLLPAFAAMGGATLLLSVLLAPISTVHTTGLTGIWATFYVSNVFLYRLGTGYFDISSNLDPLVHTWTLGVEEQFYVFFPVCLALVLRFRRSRRIAAAVIALVSVVSFALAVELSHSALLGSHQQQLSFYGSPTRAWEFGSGAVLALLGLRIASRRFALPAGVAGVGLIALGAASISGTTGYPSWNALLPVGGAALAIAAGPAFLGVRPLAWVGDVSYSWYLWHWPLIVFAAALYPGSPAATRLAAVASIGPAYLSYRYVETPIRRRPLTAAGALRLAGACLVAPLAASAALLGANHAVLGSAPGRAYAAAEVQHVDVVRGCEGPHVGAIFTPECTWRVRRPRGVLVLVGDSNASHFSESIVGAGRRAGYEVRVATFWGCPFTSLLVYDAAGATACRSFDSRLLHEILALRPALVFVAARDDGYVDGHIPIAMPGHAATVDARERALLWELGLGVQLRRLVARDIPAVVVEPVPLARADVRECAVLRILARACGPQARRRTVDERLADVLRADRRAVRSAPGSFALDLRSSLCSPSACGMSRHGVFLYHDLQHLSVPATKLLEPAFGRAIARYARRS